ncbi:hypothetical protein VOLCADRAFT_106980 [Volvox carteri f. nagariensis]|uniref:Uncharacterized protein n=1 Tax=Volvox carteri f. nagariensis TaxID=3068 RepID=D8UB47_VOLCA|nr:uncharacterized protein VOLCADRAFT_106980 [Volvox carteri f. nagariensis]EFJ43045.1 hypothetical protein VOLCADRAFT_106980 [Volvox carteri f. nagariensis]|eukprot:XP_002955844.1 hypothetical protein VOLCADRAFT_106980 [Volvox carteri f. nagariensis]
MQLAGILKPSPLAKPKAFITLNIGGLSAGAVGDLFAHRALRTVELTGDGCPASALVDGLSIVSAANPSVTLAVIDQMGVQNCKEGCVEQNLASAAEDAQLDLSALDLSQQEAKLFAVELGSVYAGLKGQLAAVQQRNELKVQQNDVELYEISIMGMHALINKYGQDSPEVFAATSAVVKLLKWAVEALDAVYDGDTVYQVLAMQKGPTQTATFTRLVNWKDQTRRQLLAATFPDADEKTQAQLFSVKAAGYGSFILLLYFTLASIWCMCNMPFKRDTLLYGSKKEQ